MKHSFTENTPVGLRRRGKKPPKLSTQQMLEIADRVIRGCEAQVDLAKEYRISTARISTVVTQVRKHPEVIRERIEKET